MLLLVTLTLQGQELTVQELKWIKATENLPFGLRQRVSLTPAPENLKRLSFNIALLVSLGTLSSKVFRMLFLLTSLLFGVWINGTLGNISLTSQGHSHPLKMQTKSLIVCFVRCQMILTVYFLKQSVFPQGILLVLIVWTKSIVWLLFSLLFWVYPSWLFLPQHIPGNCVHKQIFF